MKETVNVNIGSQAFTLDEDAYRVLRNYLEDIRSRLPEYDTETMATSKRASLRFSARSFRRRCGSSPSTRSARP